MFSGCEELLQKYRAMLSNSKTDLGGGGERERERKSISNLFVEKAYFSQLHQSLCY